MYMWKYSPKSSSFNTGESEKMQDTNGVASQESTFHIDEEFFQKSGKVVKNVYHHICYGCLDESHEHIS